ncbi:transcriptional regulator [Archaeoglobales archaeon]|nr:MAG: transcriptional regulator [Archaeoglobales archaeon]
MELRALADRICGDIVFSDSPGKALRKWRLIFNITPNELAKKLKVSPSVISDYESERRRSPGVAFIKRFINALFEIDKERGYKIISKYRCIMGLDSDTIIDMAEYKKDVNVFEFCERIDGEMLNDFKRFICGHTVVDSIRAILTMNAFDFYRLYGLTSERALIFTKVSSGRSPMVAVRVSNLKPSAVVLHDIASSKVDEVAKRIAEIERIPLITTSMDVEKMVKNLRRSFV